MSAVQDQVDRLKAIKERMRTNLVAQGVAVPEDMMLDAMAEQVLSVAGDDGVSCTHSWNGTTLTITSASGTSSADLKGDTGEADYTKVAEYEASAKAAKTAAESAKAAAADSESEARSSADDAMRHATDAEDAMTAAGQERVKAQTAASNAATSAATATEQAYIPFWVALL